MNKLPKILVIAGPTCSGKTKLAHLIADKIDSEIISADSRQIYKYLDVGTSKPLKSEINKYKYHCVDICLPEEIYSAGKFQQDGRSVISKILKKNKLPIIVGGTGLYLKAVVDGLTEEVESDSQVKEKLNDQLKLGGLNKLFEELKKVDPQTAEKIDSKNPRRILRALEVFYTTGKSISQLHLNSKIDKIYNPIFVGLMWQREKLYYRINNRVDEMIKLGFIDEVKNLLSKGYAGKLQSMQTVGYKELIDYLKNKISLSEAINLIKQNTRRFCKRQITWFKKEERIKWFEVGEEEDLINAARKVIEILN